MIIFRRKPLPPFNFRETNTHFKFKSDEYHLKVFNKTIRFNPNNGIVVKRLGHVISSIHLS